MNHGIALKISTKPLSIYSSIYSKMFLNRIYSNSLWLIFSGFLLSLAWLVFVSFPVRPAQHMAAAASSSAAASSAPAAAEAIVPAVASSSSVAPSYIGGMPPVLNSIDAVLYAEIFKAQSVHDWKKADELLAKTASDSLRGIVLAERYLNRHYKAEAAELAAWLDKYSSLPQAHGIFRLAGKTADIRNYQLKAVAKPSILPLRGDDNGLAANFRDSEHYDDWKAAIAYYRAGNYAQAAEIFDQLLAEREKLPTWKISAAGFWSWRTHKQLGNDGKALESLQIAARAPRSFYGMLAYKQLGRKLDVINPDLPFDNGKMQLLLPYPAIARATALMQSGRNDLAEYELRALAVTLPAEAGHALLSLSQQWSLPALQIALAARFNTDSGSLDMAKFPIPQWQPVGGFNIDPALIYALIRQESGFKNGAISPAGAMGLMQLMPSTASMMINKLGAYHIHAASEAEQNITLGQSYVAHLLENNLVRHNVIYMLVAYNAGIARLQEWKNAGNFRDDPLLFIETIPYAETRYYVMQVMTNYWIYSDILGVSAPTLAALAANKWPLYGKAA